MLHHLLNNAPPLRGSYDTPSPVRAQDRKQAVECNGTPAEKQTPFRLAPAGRQEKATLVLHIFLWSLSVAS